jgi:hypothetical protein
LTQFAITLRDGAANILQQHAYLNKLGTDGLVALGFDAADAQEVLNLIDYMATLAQVYKGTATQATAFPFEDALSVLWAGQ